MAGSAEWRCDRKAVLPGAPRGRRQEGVWQRRPSFLPPGKLPEAFFTGQISFPNLLRTDAFPAALLREQEGR